MNRQTGSKWPFTGVSAAYSMVVATPFDSLFYVYVYVRCKSVILSISKCVLINYL